ncbi:hypothetical protein L1286_13015 [Pseudoalteromonas sp. SMS1]|uniref:hypothetical protein n=1 Tax=Pseudoalteromonas sp. SMS1 TaxID=2908894 RepID=UPI001F311B7F|nr:hypothetical protein [Pseudoalteromonas sp. SMS1]MCF2858402.1 hypothetical protein [Pseudoalteromonas sp. SMS1]
MHRFLAVIFLFMLVGCKTTGTYEQTSLELTGMELIEPYYGYYKSWVPLGSNHSLDLDDSQRGEPSIALRTCIKQLQSSHAKAPSHALRSVQLIECMKKKGWQLLIEEIFIVS